MILSEKGKLKIFDNLYWVAEEFDADDFEGAVVLTVEEAQRIRWAMNPAPEDCVWRDLLEKRIEQAESKERNTEKKPIDHVNNAVKKIELTDEEAKLARVALDRLGYSGIGEFHANCIKTAELIQQRIERVERER